MDWIHSLTASHAMFLSSLILIAAYIFIASEKISKVTIALIGACITIILGLVGSDKFSGNAINPLYYVNFIDFNVIFLLIGMMLIVAITARTGVFNLMAIRLMALARGKPIGILFSIGIFTGLLSAFLDNVTTVILVMPITFSVCEKLDIKPIPFLLCEIFASNIGGTATLIGDPPNIIIGSAANLSFMDFLRELTPIVFLVLFVVIISLCLFFRKDLKASPERILAFSKTAAEKVEIDKPAMYRSLSILFIVIVGFITHDSSGIPTSVIALLGASILMLFEKPESLFREIEWNTIFFFIGLFIIVGGLEASGAIKLMASETVKLTGGSQCAASMVILWVSGIVSGVIDNIPYTATMTPMILEIQKEMGVAYAHPLWWSLSLGACLGGNMTIIGAAANVIVSETAAKRGYKITFISFLKYGILTMLISLAMSTIYLLFRFFI